MPQSTACVFLKWMLGLSFSFIFYYDHVISESCGFWLVITDIRYFGRGKSLILQQHYILLQDSILDSSFKINCILFLNYPSKNPCIFKRGWQCNYFYKQIDALCLLIFGSTQHTFTVVTISFLCHFLPNYGITMVSLKLLTSYYICIIVNEL